MKQENLRRAQRIFMASVGVVGFAGSTYGTDNVFTWLGPGTAGGNASWTVGANWQGGTAPPITPAAGDNTTLVFGGNLNSGTSAQNGPTSATNADWTIQGLIFNDYSAGAATFVINTSGTASRTLRLGAGGITDTALGSVSLNGSNGSDTHLVLTADQTWNVATAGNNNLIVRRSITGNFTLTKTGAGSLQFTAAAGMADFNGTLDLKQGGVRLDTVGTQFASASAHIVVDAANDTSISATGVGLDQTINGVMFFGGSGSFGFSGSSNFFLTNTVTLLNGDKRMNQGGTRTTNFDGPIVGPGGISKIGGGTFAFHASNSYAGNTNIFNGTISVGSFGQLGTSTNAITLGDDTGGPPLPSGTIHVTGTGADATTSRPFLLRLGGGNLSFVNTLTINNTITGTGPLTKVGAATLTVNSVQVATLTTSTGTMKMNPDGSDAATNRVRALVLGGATGAWTSTLDLNNNSLIVDYDPLDPQSPLGQIQDQLKSGYAGGAWNGPGIQSSAAAATTNTALGYAESSVVLGAGGGTFKGQSVDGTAVLVRYTLYGDANLDGTVDTVDFNNLASNFSQSGNWSQGDFNFDGVVDTVDFNLLAANFSQSLPASGLGSLVPEPISLLSVGLFGFAATARRRQRR
jgi:autotransporter-associated beta strand protein